MDQELFVKWTAAGHEVISERGLFRHKSFKKAFPRDAVVKVDGAPLMNYGKPVKIADLLPERADLALDADGNVVSQEEFGRRYLQWLGWFSFVEGSDITAEPVPGVLDYLIRVPDRFSESPGFVDVNYDARVPAPEKTHEYDAATDRLIPIVEKQGKALEFLLEKATRGPGRPRKDEAA